MMNTRRLLTALGAAAIALIFLGGCKSTYTFKVDSLSNPEIKGLSSYRIVSSNASIQEGDLEFQEAAEYVRAALSSKGMYEAPDIESAEMVVDISYGIGEATTDFKTVQTPKYEVRGGGVTTVMQPVMDSKGRIRYVATTVYQPPKVEIAGLEEKTVPMTTYEKFLRMTARDNREVDAETESPPQVWSIYVKNKDESDDLRKYIPLMTAASMDYVGQNTEKQKEVRLKEDDESLEFVKAGL